MLEDQFKQQERPGDRTNQESVLRRLCAFKGPTYAFVMTSTGSVFDAFINNGPELAAIAEVKCRTCTFSAYEQEGYRIDRHKIDMLIASGRRHGVDAVLVVRWKCGTHGYVNLTGMPKTTLAGLPTKYVQRGDRDELPDRQSDIPMGLFKRF